MKSVAAHEVKRAFPGALLSAVSEFSRIGAIHRIGRGRVRARRETSPSNWRTGALPLDDR